jgi:hypothetical protein
MKECAPAIKSFHFSPGRHIRKNPKNQNLHLLLQIGLKRKLLWSPEGKTDCNEKCIPYHAHPDIRLPLKMQLLLEFRGGVTGNEH